MAAREISIPAVLIGQAQRKRAMLSLAPLIDVTFLLLIFFLLVTQFTRLAPVDVTLGTPSSVSTQQPGAGSSEVSRLEVREDGRMILDGVFLESMKALEDTLSGLVQDTRSEIAGDEDAGRTSQYRLLIDPDAEVSVQQLIDLLTLLNDFPRLMPQLVSREMGRETPAPD